MPHITHEEILPIGTIVKTNDLMGEVIKSWFGKDQFNFPICCHEILYFATYKRLHGYNYQWQPIKHKTVQVNYTGIYVFNFDTITQKDALALKSEVFIDKKTKKK